MTAKFTKGPWAWFGNAASNHVYLATWHSGRRYVMDFKRWGMRGAQPRFQPDTGMKDAKDLLFFAVGDKSVVGVEAAKKDTSVYRLDIRGINAPDAHLIAAAPELYEALTALLENDGGEGSKGYSAFKYHDARQACFAALAKARGEAA